MVFEGGLGALERRLDAMQPGSEQPVRVGAFIRQEREPGELDEVVRIRQPPRPGWLSEAGGDVTAKNLDLLQSLGQVVTQPLSSGSAPTSSVRPGVGPAERVRDRLRRRPGGSRCRE